MSLVNKTLIALFGLFHLFICLENSVYCNVIEFELTKLSSAEKMVEWKDLQFIIDFFTSRTAWKFESNGIIILIYNLYFRFFFILMHFQYRLRGQNEYFFHFIITDINRRVNFLASFNNTSI